MTPRPPSVVRAVERPTPSQLDDARSAVAATLAPTPLVASPALRPGAVLKVEIAQPTGSFKARGAVAALTALPSGAEVVTTSTGNHALAVAWAAKRLDRDARIVVPATASSQKLAALRRLTNAVELVGSTFDEAEAYALAATGDGIRYLSPYNDPLVIAGQATIGAELEDVREPMTVVVPVGGGGLISGIALWARHRPSVRVVGVEIDASRAMHAALQAGRVVPVDVRPTLADGVAGNIEPGAVTVDIVRERVDELVAVSEDDVAAAMRFLAAEHGLVAEGAGALAVAAVRARRATVVGRPVAIVTGRNVPLSTLGDMLAGRCAS